MNRELIINVTPTEISIALAEDKVLVELNKEQCQTGFSVGDIYLGKVRKIMPGLNAAFVNIGHEKDAFIHYLDLGSQVFVAQKARGGATARQAQASVSKESSWNRRSKRAARSAPTSKWGRRSWCRWPKRPFRPKARA